MDDLLEKSKHENESNDSDAKHDSNEYASKKQKRHSGFPQLAH